MKKTHIKAQYGNTPTQPHCNQRGDTSVTSKFKEVTCEKCLSQASEE